MKSSATTIVLDSHHEANDVMDIEQYLMIPADEIDYPSVDLASLVALAVQRVEPFVATSALGELAQRHHAAAGAAAVTILAAPNWDHHLYAHALGVLFRQDVEAALDVMRQLIPTCEDPVVLEEMISCVAWEPELFATGNPRELASALAKRVLAAPASRGADLEERAAFLELFS